MACGMLYLLYAWLGGPTCSAQTTAQIAALFPPSSATYTAVQSGAWTNTATWGGSLPTANSKVYIPSGLTISLTGTTTATLDWLRIDGTFNLPGTATTSLTVGTILITTGGQMNIGSSTTPVAAANTVAITFPSGVATNTDWDRWLISRGIIVQGAFTSYGAVKTPFLPLATPPVAGATSITLLAPPTGWRVGDQLVLTGTMWAGNNDFGDEVLLITGISGRTVSFQNLTNGNAPSLKYDHTPEAGYGFEVYVANITRNIVLQSAGWSTSTLNVKQRGHFIGHHTHRIQVNYMGLYGMGKSNKDDYISDPDGEGNGLENPRGRYPFHIHMANMVDPPSLSGPAAQVTGCVVQGSPGWGFVAHNSHVNFYDNVSFDVIGGHFVTEDGNELSEMKRNIAIRAVSGKDPANLLQPDDTRGDLKDFGVRGIGYWLSTGYDVVVEDNIASSCAYNGCIIYGHNDVHASTIPYVPTASLPANQQYIAGGAETVQAWKVPVTSFKNNTFMNCGGGMDIRGITRDDQGWDFFRFNHFTRSVFENCRVYNVKRYGVMIAYAANIHLKDWVIIGNKTAPIQRGDLTGPDDPWGGGIYCNKNIRHTIFENNRVEGFEIGLSTLQTGGNGMALEFEDDFNKSWIDGGYFANNEYNLFPCNSNYTNNPTPKLNPNPGVNNPPFPLYFGMVQEPTFVISGSNTLPTAAYSQTSLGAHIVYFDALASNDPDYHITYPNVNNQSTIAIYQWNFGDGTTDFGARLRHTFPGPGAYPVTLTVYDYAGSKRSISKTITVTTSAASNIVENGNFSGPLVAETVTLNTKYAFNSGSLSTNTFYTAGNSQWNISGGALVNTQSAGAPSVAQMIHDDYKLKGTQYVSFDGTNSGDANMRVAVWGVKGRFNLSVWQPTEAPGNINHEIPFTADLLLDYRIPQSSSAVHRSEAIALGSGYEWIIVRVMSLNRSGTMRIDNIALGNGTGIVGDTPTYYTLTTATSGSGAITLNPTGGSYEAGTVVTAQATPATGWQFAGWNGASTDTTNPASITMNSNQTLTAMFSQINSTPGTISLQAEDYTSDNGNGIVSTALAGYTGTGYYDMGSIDSWVEYTFTATSGIYDLAIRYANGSGADRACTVFIDGVSIDDTFSDTGAWTTWLESTHTITLSTTDTHTIRIQVATASGGPNADVLTLAPTDSTPTYTLSTATTGSGTITLNPANSTYAAGAIVTATATPASGWEFTGWSGAATGTTNPVSITMDANKTLEASFAKIPTSGYQYYRFTCTATNDNQMIVNGIEVLAGSTAYTLSEYWQVLNMPTTATKTLNAGTAIDATTLRIYTVWNTDRAPSDYTLEGSNDNNTWTLLLQESGLPGSTWPSNGTRDIVLGTSTSLAKLSLTPATPPSTAEALPLAYPNPTSTYLSVTDIADAGVVSVMQEATGQIISLQATADGIVDVSMLSTGTYTLLSLSGKLIRFIKQ